MSNSLSAVFVGAVLATIAFGVLGCAKNDEGADAPVESIRAELQTVQATLVDVKKSIDELKVTTAEAASKESGKHEIQVALSDIKKLLEELEAALEEKLSKDAAMQEDDIEVEIHSVADAKKLIAELGDEPTAQDLALSLAEIDLWIVSPEEEEAFVEFKTSMITKLQAMVVKEVTDLQQKALKADSGDQAEKLHSQAGQVLAMFPLTESPEVLEKARSLANEHSEVAVRLQVIRRQRYNQWAAERIENAINGYHANSSTLSPIAENPLLVKSCVKELAEVDPALLEPAVLELYSYVLDLTNQAIAEKDKVTLSKGLSDPKVRRKSLGDF